MATQTAPQPQAEEQKITTKTYAHIRQTDEKGKIKDSAVPGATIESMKEDKEEFDLVSTLSYIEWEFQSYDEFLNYNKTKDGTEVTPDAKLAWVNRGWTLAQQQTARQLVMADDPQYVNKDTPVDIDGEAVAERERRKQSPETKARKSLDKFAATNQAGFASMLADFVNTLPPEQRAMFESMVGVSK